MELYEKLAPTILIWNKEFREAEEREARAARKTIDDAPTVPSSEATFVEAVTQTSLALTAQLDVVDEPLASTHQAIVFEKLIKAEEPEEEIPSGI